MRKRKRFNKKAGGGRMSGVGLFLLKKQDQALCQKLIVRVK